ncbi:MAG: hypothetical protein AAGA81_00580 [Acidobacteriota bacterium]
MTETRSTLRVASLGLSVSGVLHILAFLVAGIAPITIAFVVVGALYCGLARGLRGGSYRVTIPVYLLMLLGSVASVGSMGSPPIPSWWWALILAADAVTAAALFGYLWRGREASAEDRAPA